MVVQNSFRNLSLADLQQVLLVCEQLHQADPQKPFVQHCHQVMHKALGNVHFSAERYEIVPLQLLEQTLDTLDNGDYWIPLFTEHLHEHPFARRLPLLSSPDINMTQYESGAKEFQESTLFNEFYDRIEAQNQIWIGIRDGNELLTCVYSREREYSEVQLAMMCLIQPHLESAWKNWKNTRSLQQEVGVLKQAVFQTEEEEAAAALIRRAIDALPPRQRDVVELVADGKDNQQIADALRISVGTVKKHLQAVFRSLDVAHRTELAAQWHRAHSITLY